CFDWTPMLASRSGKSARTIDKPSPVPPKRRVMDPSACEKGAQILSSASGAIPNPVSSTSTVIDVSLERCAHTTTLPRSVNLIAFAIRLVNTCCNLTKSLLQGGRPAGTSTTSSTSLLPMRGAQRDVQRCTTSATLTLSITI